MRPSSPVGVLFQPTGVDGHGRATAGRTAAQDPLAGGIVDVEFRIGGTDQPLRQMI